MNDDTYPTPTPGPDDEPTTEITSEPTVQLPAGESPQPQGSWSYTQVPTAGHYAALGHGYVSYPPPTPPERTSHRGIVTAAAGVGAAFVLGVSGLSYAAGSHVAQASQEQSTPAQTQPDAGGNSGPRLLPPGGEGDTSSTSAVDATAEQEQGLVYINTVVGYGNAQAAGTGMVLTSNGTILTNHHVIDGATQIQVEVISTGQTYSADLVGYDDTADVAVLQLQDASGLDTVKLDDSGDVNVGDEIVAVGNANGDGGAASASAGTVTALDQSITAQAEDSSENLTGLIEVDADVISGDSGGALYGDNGEVIGMTTAASSGSANITGYAVPIEDALSVAKQIEAGDESGSVQTGGNAFLGLQLSSQTDAPYVAGTIEGSPAEQAGIADGSTITAIDGQQVSTADDLTGAISQHEPGESISVTWIDPSGQQYSADATLTTGPVG